MAYRGTSEHLPASLDAPVAEGGEQVPVGGKPAVLSPPRITVVPPPVGTVPAQADELEKPSIPPAIAGDMKARLVAAQEAFQQRDFAAVARLLNPADLTPDTSLDTRIEWADLLGKANHTEQSDAMFEAMMASNPGSRRLRFVYARRLHLRGFLGGAVELLRGVLPFPVDTYQRTYTDRLFRTHGLFADNVQREIDPEEDCRLLAMKYAMESFRNRPLQPLPAGRIGRISLITGGLGPGGAERQLSRTAVELERARQRGELVGGIAIERPVEVLVRSHSPKQQRDFFLADLLDANVDVREIDKMPVATTEELGVEDPDLVTMLDYLPIKVNFGVRRLAAHFRETKPDVVSLWQDGACLFGGLAALLAGVPRVQLVIRGLPPVIRRHMLLPEHEVMYRAMANVPGVEFISNSKGAARAYAEWLDVPIERFKIVYNGVPKMPCEATPSAEAQWQEFDARTADADQTIGGVFRFDTDKRPTWWMRFAYHYARRHPKARFVVVGDGRLFPECAQMAQDLKIADRTLFVGRSTEVGYWMKKMDVLLLMSSFEGLPNVLIEAQYLGVPVVSTPAGGASECFLEGVTGHILGSADRTDFEEACQKVHALLGKAQQKDVFGPATRDFLEPNFSVPRMLENFLRATCGVS